MKPSNAWFLLLVTLLIVVISTDASGGNWLGRIFKPKNKSGSKKPEIVEPPELKSESNDVPTPATPTTPEPLDNQVNNHGQQSVPESLRQNHEEHDRGNQSKIRRLMGMDEMIAEYDEINRQLVDEVDSDEPVKNLMIALDWLKEAAKNKDQNKIQALVQFTSLLKLLVPTNIHCDLVGLNILRKNVEASGINLMLPDDEVGALRRIDNVIRDVALEHAAQCKFEYPKTFKWARQNTAKERVYKDIKKMLDKVLETSTRHVFTLDDRKDERTILKERAIGIVNMKGEHQAEAVLKYVKLRAVEDSDIRYLSPVSDQKRRRKWIVDENKVKSMLQKYSLSQCEYLVKATKHIMDPALYEEKIWPPFLRYKGIDEDFMEFTIWMDYYRICDSMIGQDREVFTRNVIKLIDEKY